MAYLIKPFEKRDLLPAIEMAVSRFAEIKALENEVSGLRERLEARKLIERAKGALMTAHEMTEPQAFRWIQRAAMDNRTSMRAVAELVLSGETGESGQSDNASAAIASDESPDLPANPAN
jgi:response regulator NasT